MTTSNTSTNDEVTDALLRARLALGDGDQHLAGLIEAALQRRSATTPPALDRRIARALAYIHANLSSRRKASLSAIASVACMSDYHFSRCFHDALGITLRAYLLRQRLDLAKELLAHRLDIPIAAVALDAGFANQSSFGTVFKKEFGCTPRIWRQRMSRRCDGARKSI